jgi:hypothetical protein
MSDEWIQLTPEEDIVKQGGKALYHYCTTTSHFPHHLIWESDDDDKSAHPLSNAEAIAFIIHSGLWREVPEVKALIAQIKYAKELWKQQGWISDAFAAATMNLFHKVDNGNDAPTIEEYYKNEGLDQDEYEGEDDPVVPENIAEILWHEDVDRP